MTEGNCKDAASQLGEKYIKVVTRQDAPAGCWKAYWHEVYFNRITDHSLTSPNSNFLAICKQGTEYMVILYFEL